MPTLSSRRRPWPWDMRLMLAPTTVKEGQIGSYRGQTIGSLRGRQIWTLRGVSRTFHPSQGFMLVPTPDGLLVGKKQTNLENVYPQAPDYDSAPVYRERTFMFRPTAGYGEGVQDGVSDRNYHYGINVWCFGGLVGRGPLSHSLTPDTTGPIRRFAEARAGGVMTLFILAGPYVLQRVSDTNSGHTVSRTRAGQVSTDAARYQGGFAGAVDSLYVAWSDGVIEEFNGSTWANCALPSGFNPNFLEVVGDELWAADATRSIIRKVTSDPKVAGNWSGPYQIGDPSSPITAIRSTNNQLVIFKQDGGIFTVNADGSDSDLFPGLTTTPDPNNARTAWAWLGALWFRVGQAFYRLDMGGGAQLTPTGPQLLLGNASEVRGPVQAFMGWNAQMAFGVIWNPSNNTSYLMQYGSWAPKAGEDSAVASFQAQWDGALVKWTNRRATALWVSNVPEEARLYVGFLDGGYDYIKLVPYPLERNSGGEYTMGESYMVLPLHHATYQADRKQWVGFSGFGPVFDLGDSMTVSYRLAGSAGMPSSQPSGDYVKLPQSITFNGQRIELDQQVAGYSLDIRLDFLGPNTTHTLALEGIGVHERLVPQFRRDFTFLADANDVVARRDGSTTRRSGQHIRDMLMEAAAQPASITLEFPDETVSDVGIFQYTERQVTHDKRYGLGWTVEMQATQFKLTEVYGIIARTRGTRIGDLRGFEIKDLRYM